MRRELINNTPGKKDSTRTAFTSALLELAGANPNIVLVSSDSVSVYKAAPFLERYPDRVVEVGISEQNAVAAAAGMASAGIIPFVATYAGFLTMRACEQIRTFVGYPGLGVKLMGANAGIYAGGREGVTHQFFEDIGIMRTIPGFTVVAPADPAQLRKAVIAVAGIPGPAYIRVGGGRDPVVFDRDVPFELGKARVIREYGTDVALFSCGHMLPRVLSACDRLHALGTNAMAVEVHTIKPIDGEMITEVLSVCKAAVTVEDHNIIGGLGSAVCEVAAANCPVPVARIGVKDVYTESGAGDELLDAYGMGVFDIIDAALKVKG